MRLYHYNRQYNFGPESSFFCRFDKNAKHKPMSEFNFCGADIQLCSEEQREIAFTSERLGVDTIRKKLTALSVNSLCDVVWRAVAETIRRLGRVSLPTQLVLKLITKQETPE
jgi:hypothetical protein